MILPARNQFSLYCPALRHPLGLHIWIELGGAAVAEPLSPVSAEIAAGLSVRLSQIHRQYSSHTGKMSNTCSPVATTPTTTTWYCNEQEATKASRRRKRAWDVLWRIRCHASCSAGIQIALQLDRLFPPPCCYIVVALSCYFHGFQFSCWPRTTDLPLLDTCTTPTA